MNAIGRANRYGMATNHTPLTKGGARSAAYKANRNEKGDYQALEIHARNILILSMDCTWRNEAAPSDFSDRAAKRYEEAGIRLEPVLFRCLF